MVARFEDDQGVKEHRFIFSGAEHDEPLPAVGAVRWCYPNDEEIGFYRLQPAPSLRTKLLGAGLSKLSAVEQMGLLEDQWALVRNASGTIGEFIDVLTAISRPADGKPAPTADHNVLRAIADRLGTLELLIEDGGDAAALAGFRSWVRAQLGPDLAALGYTPRPKESQNDIQRRAVLIHAVGKLGRDPRTLEEAVRIAEEERRDPRSVDPNLAGGFLALSAMQGDEVRYQRWLETYRARRDSGAPPQTTLRYLYTFAEFRPDPLVARTLGHVDEGTIPQEAASPVLGQLLGMRHSQLACWSYVKRSWEGLRRRVGDMGVSRVVESTGALPHPLRADVVAFFEQNPPLAAERALARALERMDEREELRTRVTAELVARFAGRV
jgi:hypothetical protein